MVFKKGDKTWLGKTHSKETKRKISKAMKGQIPWNKGKTVIQKHSKEAKRKTSEVQNGKKKSRI